MAVPEGYSFTRYLEAKKGVDDRALNGHVWRALAGCLPPSSQEKPLRVLEAGTGVGAMAERMVSRGLFRHAIYTGVDVDGESIACARLRAPGGGVSLRFVEEDFFGFAARAREKWDLLVAHAFLDLVDLPSALPPMLGLLGEGGVFYFSLNFDGVTIMEPAHALDDLVFGLYHRSMDERKVNGKSSGNSRTGRRLFSELPSLGARIAAAGGSDWAVFPGPEGYPGDEAYFLHHIVHAIEEELKGRLDAGQLEAWAAERHGQIEEHRLVYLAHQLDFVGTVRCPPGPG